MVENPTPVNEKDSAVPAAQAIAEEIVRPVPFDACYALAFKDEGVFIKVFEETLEGAPLNPGFVSYDLNRRNIKGLDINNVLLRIRKHESMFKIADKQEEKQVDSGAAVSVSKDGMSATMALLPPSSGGSRACAQQILQNIKQEWKVVFGIDEQSVLNMAQRGPYFKPFVIAAGKLPEKGADGYLNFMFKKERPHNPVILSDGNADYKNLNLFENVTAGSAVVEKVPPEKGVDGCTVRGETLPAKPGAETKLPVGRNTYISGDGQTLLAAKSGRVDFINNRVEISDVYKIPGDVDMSVGNINFEGDVIIRGNVIAGLTVQASGLIEVSGFVEGSTLIAGKDIVLKNGIQGQDAGKLVAGGNIIAKFLEHCSAEARGSVISDYIVHCSVLAGNSITMRGKWGKIIGGIVRAGNEITANFIGSPSYDATVIELGAAPDIRARFCECETQRLQLKTQIQKIDSIARVVPANDTPERQEMRKKLIDTREHLEKQYNDLVEKIAGYNEMISLSCGGRVNVLRTAYPNVKITIDTAVLILKTNYDFVTFKNREGEIVFPSCEVTP